MPWECFVFLVMKTVLITFIAHERQICKPAQFLHTTSVPIKGCVVSWLSSSWITLTDADTHHKKTSILATSNQQVDPFYICLDVKHLWKRLSMCNTQGRATEVLDASAAIRRSSNHTPPHRLLHTFCAHWALRNSHLAMTATEWKPKRSLPISAVEVHETCAGVWLRTSITQCSESDT